MWTQAQLNSISNSASIIICKYPIPDLSSCESRGLKTPLPLTLSSGSLPYHQINNSSLCEEAHSSGLDLVFRSVGVWLLIPESNAGVSPSAHEKFKNFMLQNSKMFFPQFLYAMSPHFQCLTQLTKDIVFPYKVLSFRDPIRADNKKCFMGFLCRMEKTLLIEVSEILRKPWKLTL